MMAKFVKLLLIITLVVSVVIAAIVELDMRGHLVVEQTLTAVVYKHVVYALLCNALVCLLAIFSIGKRKELPAATPR